MKLIIFALWAFRMGEFFIPIIKREKNKYYTTNATMEEVEKSVKSFYFLYFISLTIGAILILLEGF